MNSIRYEHKEAILYYLMISILMATMIAIPFVNYKAWPLILAGVIGMSLIFYGERFRILLLLSYLITAVLVIFNMSVYYNYAYAIHISNSFKMIALGIELLIDVSYLIINIHHGGKRRKIYVL
jgi:hypothetical protein